MTPPERPPHRPRRSWGATPEKPKLSVVTDFRNPHEGALHRKLHAVVGRTLEQAWDDNTRVDAEVFDVIAYQVLAELLGYIEGVIVLGGTATGPESPLEIVLKGSMQAGIGRAARIHRKVCERPRTCGARERLTEAAARYDRELPPKKRAHFKLWG